MTNTTLTNCHAFIGNGEILPNATVAISGTTIDRIATDISEVADPGEVVDLDGGWLLPGFIDTHVHLCMDGSADMGSVRLPREELTRMAAKFATRTLQCGVTTIRDLGGIGTIVQAVRAAVDSGTTPGPRILTAGRMICVTDGHGHTLGAIQADGPEAIAEAVREVVNNGADVIKLMSTGGVLTPGTGPGMAQMSLEELTAGVDQARAFGKRTAAHAQGRDGILNALKAGIDTIEHGYHLDETCIGLMRDNGTTLVPTCAPSHHMTTRGLDGGLARETYEKAIRCMEAKQASFRLALDSDTPMAMGSDAGTPFNHHGSNLMELVLMVRRGMSVEQALMAGTSVAARALGLEKTIGLIRPGYAADLVVLTIDPFRDIEMLGSPDAVRMVMRNGTIHARP